MRHVFVAQVESMSSSCCCPPRLRAPEMDLTTYSVAMAGVSRSDRIHVRGFSSPRPITRRERIPTASGEERNRSSVYGVCHTNALASARPNRYARTESIRPRSLSSAHVLHLLVL